MRVLSRKGKISASVLAFVVAAVMVFGLWPQSAGAAENTVADDLTVNKWHDENALDDSTRNVGRIWTDKSVSTGDVELTGPDGHSDAKTIRKSDDSDFLVGLSALSSTASITGQSTVPLDIVLVLDVSGSMDDRDSNGNKKIEKLKEAVNSFIDETAKVNNGRPANLQSRISLVKFAGNKTNRVGNDTYRDGRFTYNYTQIVRNYGAYTDTNKSQLKDMVDALSPAGATAADNAMDLAKTLVEQSKTDADASVDRKNVQRVVIFFTDGQPTTFSDFSATVANNAIASARTIKSDAYIYTIGVFDAADTSVTGHTGGGPWTDEERFNAYMHGLSSNYPDATNYRNLGERAKDSKGEDTQYYKAATNAADLNNIFTEIGAEIVSSAQSPTKVDQGEDPDQTGYITITDQLGDYMQVDDLNTLLYANQELTSGTQGYSRTETTEGNKTTVTYTFDYDIPDTNHVYPEGNLKDIVITVEKTTGDDQLNVGDLVTVKIPASLIPLRYYEIDKDGNMTIDETFPMRLFYDVSLKDGVAEKIENPDALLQAYIDANKDDEGHVNFYTNKYDKDSQDEDSEGVGAYSHFEPASTNDFYYFQNNVFLYTDEACTDPATGAIDTSGNTTYYYQRDYYELGSDGKAEKKTITVTIPGNSNELLDGFAQEDEATGQYYIPAGTPRTTSLTFFTEDKETGANKTDTAKTSIKPVWERNFRGNSVTTYLGNNGRMTFDLPGQLDISKTVKAEDGHAVPDSLKEQEFEYKLELTAKEGSELKDEYTAQLYNGQTAVGDSFKIKPGDTFTLTDGQTLKIYGLAAGTDYTVTEMKAEHFTASVTQDNAGDNAKIEKAESGDVSAKGTIPGNEAASVAFTNTYKADPATLDGSVNLKLRKDFVTASGASAWDMEYLSDAEFTFYLAADGSDVPMPDGSIDTAGGRAAIVKVKSADEINKVFGDITYTEPGTYSYRIVERDPGADKKLGVSYSYAAYTVTVTVTDNGGTLEAEAVMAKVRDDGGTDLDNAETVADKTAVFRNVYDADSESVDVRASKVFTDYTGSRQLKDGEYTFRLTAKDGAPLPGGATDYIETTNTGIGVVFDSVTVTAEYAKGATKDAPIRYEYTLEEVLPAGATAENGYTVDGVKYDPTKYTVRFKVYIDTVDGRDTVIVDRTYLDAEGNKITTDVPVFHNSYRADSLTLTGDTALRGDKTLTGRAIREGETFNFTLTAGDDSTAKAIADGIIKIAEGADSASVTGTVAEGTAEDFTFGAVTFTKEGTYTFDIKETIPDPEAGGMTYDTHTAKVTVVVKYDEDYNLKATVSYDNGTVDDAKDRAVFKNSYEASHIYGGLNVEKVLTGRTMKAGEFTFTITPSEGAPAISDSDKSFTNTRKGSGIADVMQKLQGLVFTEADAGKTYVYTVAETAGDLSGVTYDGTVYTVAIEVRDNGDGTMHTVTTITWKDADGIDNEAVYDSSAAGAGTPAVRFNNSYKAADADPVDITDGFNKVLTGREWKDSDSFTFTLKALTDGAPMPDSTEVTVSKADVADGKAPISFGKIKFTEVGVYKYEVSETDPGDSGAAGVKYDTAVRIITVTVTDDDENGKLVAAVTAVEGSRTFTNKYETEDLPLDEVCAVSMTKVLYGHDMALNQFEFSINAADKASADKMGISLRQGAIFGSLPAPDSEVSTLFESLGITLTQEDIGKIYTYTFAETKGSDKGYVYDENQYKLEITTIDNEDGTLSARVVLTNTTTGEKLFDKTVSKEETALGEKGVVIPFVNRYDGSTDVDGGTKADVKADKTLTGRSLKADEFTFKLVTKPANGSEGKVLQTVKNDGSGNIAFSPLSYKTSDKAAGENAVILSDEVKDGYAVKSVDDKGRTVYTLSYRVYEDSSALPGGVSITTGSFDFTVTVTDNGDGTLTAVTNYPEGKDKFGFVNQYAADDVDVNVTGSKTLSYADGLSPADIAGKFTFEITAADGTPMPEDTTAVNDAAGNVNFGKITFKLSDLDDVAAAADGSRTKVFEYKVTETGSAAGVTNDPDAVTGKTFTITLTDDGNGHLTAIKDPADGPAFTFTNTYTVGELPSSITDQISIDKKLTGRDLRDGEFSFELLEGSEVVATGSNDAKGNVTFSSITYTEPGSHTYTVREVKGTAGGVTYDDQLYTVYTTISDNGDGTLSVKHQVIASITDNGEAVPAEKNAITFSNKYQADPTSVTIGAVKKLEGKALEAGQFTFQLKDADGKVIAEAKNDKTGAVIFDTVKFKEAGVYEYTVSEVNDKQANVKYDEHVYKIKVTVTDDGNGTLTAEVSDDSIVFTNQYKPAGTGTDTGDDSNMAVALGLMMMAATAGGAVLVRRKIKQ